MKKRCQRNTAQKFLDEALQMETDECILWPYAKQNHGYGVIFIQGKLKYVHRLALIKRQGEAPQDKPHALHKPQTCHNATCFNYRHLRWGSQRDNLLDSVLDGTHNTPRGEKHFKSKLTEKQVLSILNDRRSNAAIGIEYGVTSVAVGDIKLGKTWKWLTNSLKEKEYA